MRSTKEFTASNGKSYPLRNKHKVEFLLFVGIDPNIIIEDGFSDLGYYTFVRDEGGRKSLSTYSDGYARRFNYWENDDQRALAGQAIDADYYAEGNDE